MTNYRDHNKEQVEIKHHASDRHVRNERDARQARENADTMKQTLTWLIPLLLLLSIGYYLYRRAYTTDVTTKTTTNMPVTAPVVETKTEEAKTVAA